MAVTAVDRTGVLYDNIDRRQPETVILRSVHLEGLAGIPITAVFLFIVLPNHAKIVHKIPGRLFLYDNTDFIHISLHSNSG
jgi:hypothetical protein